MKKTEEVMEYSHIEWTDFCVEQEKKMVKIAFLQIMPGEILEEEKLAISPDGEFVSTFAELAKELDMAIAI